MFFAQYMDQEDTLTVAVSFFFYLFFLLTIKNKLV